MNAWLATWRLRRALLRSIAAGYARTFVPALGRPPVRPLFVLSHMRSGSSLFVHVLNTNPEVFGFGETTTVYRRASDVQLLPLKTLLRTRNALSGKRYVTDKLLHGRYLPEDDALRREELRAIFLVRAPETALPSLIEAPKLPGWPQSRHWNRDHVDVDRVLRYYTGRLAELERYAPLLGKRGFVLTYDELLSATDEVFASLQSFLGLDAPFRAEYETNSQTGRIGVGDTSEHIRKGYIDRAIRPHEVAVSAAVLESAQDAYERCLATLRASCVEVGLPAGDAGAA